MRLLVSACLLGLHTRYDGGHSLRPDIAALANRYELVPVCPEQLGGLPTPRVPCERRAGLVISRDGADCTLAFELGAREALKIYELTGCEAAILKARSPSCGKGPVYDGTFSGRLCDGRGVFAELLCSLSIPVYDEQEIDKLE